MMRTSGKFTLAAFTDTTTSPGPGVGDGTSSTTSDSGGPYCLHRTALTTRPWRSVARARSGSRAALQLRVRPPRRCPWLFPVALAWSSFLFIGVHLAGQNPATTPAAPAALTLLSKDGRRALAVALVNGQEFAALDDLAAAFQLTVREEAGAITVSYKGRTIVLTADQALASVSGRLVSLPAPASRVGGRWLVPVEFIGRALALIYDTRLDLRR